MRATWWGAGLLAGAVLALPQAVSADHEQDDRGWRRYENRDYAYGRYGRHGRGFDLGFERGYRDGIKQGEKDASKRRTFDPRRHDDYRDGDEGYRSSYGSRRDYSNGYRRGFEEGYRGAFDLYLGGGRYGRGRYDRGRYDPYGDRYDYARPRRY